MSSLCVITARGGSKRIPRKNIRDFCGKPIIAYSIEAALESKLFDEVMVSTDDREIADIARAYGASVPFMRSPETSDDLSTTADVLIEVLDEYEVRGKAFDILCCIYPTAPFVTSHKLKEAYANLEHGYDSVMPVTRFEFPPQRGYVERDGMLKWWFPEFASSRSQDLETVYHDVGQFYMARTALYRKERSFFAGKVKSILIPEMESQDIDDEGDWTVAEMKFKLMMGEGHDEALR